MGSSPFWKETNVTNRFVLSCTGLALFASLSVAAPALAGGCGTPGCPANLDNSDGLFQIDGADLGALLSDWGLTGTCSDLVGGGDGVDGADLGELLANWGACPASLCPASDHDCCTTGGVGCTDLACCDIVCGLDAFCCDTSWDGLCVASANANCGDANGTYCGGGGLCPPSDHDCFTAGGPGCTDIACCELVCALDPFCCDTQWDGICVGSAQANCDVPACPFECDPGATAEGEPCGTDTNGGCNSPPQGVSNCCFAGPQTGCDDAACEALICGQDPFCCDTQWDGLCAGAAQAQCGLDCSGNGGLPFGSISCGESICGNAWADGGTRDTDWYELTLGPGNTEITFSIANNLPMVIGIVDTGGVPDCSLATALNPFAVSGLCGTASFTACLPAGTYWFFAAPNGFEGFPCDSGNNEYQITLTCGGECTPAACGNSDHDCFTEGGPFCSDAGCCEIVCSVDPFCCETAWDGICVAEATQFCVDPPSNDECEGRIEIFIGDTAFSTFGATTSLPPLDPGCDKGFGTDIFFDVWFTFNSTEDNTLCISTCNNADFDTRLAVYDACDGNLIACNDDGPSCTGFTSQITFPASSGTQYLIRVGGFAGAGNGVLGLAYGECPGLECPAAANDCYTTGGPGCSDIACCELVCAADPFCCQTAWDGICVNGAFALCGPPSCDFACDNGAISEGEDCGFDTNGGCNSGGDPSFWTDLACGDVICGNAWADLGTRDTDWYRINLAVPTEITLSMSSNLPMVFGVINSIDCATATAIDPFALTAFCGTASLTVCLDAGEHWLFAGANGFDGFPCGGGANEYQLSLSCVENCKPPVFDCPASDHDCFTTGGPGCTDLACCEIVCTLDAFCCDTSWDGLCVNSALANCGGGGGVANDECADAIQLFAGANAFSTIGATTSGPALPAACEEGFGLALVNDIWFTFTATAGSHTFSLCDSGYDTRVAAYSDCSGTILGCNDDFCGLQSELTLGTTPGQVVVLRIGGFSGSGTGTLTIN